MFVKDNGYKEGWVPERDEYVRMRPSYKTQNSVDGIDPLDARAIHHNSEGNFIYLLSVQFPCSQLFVPCNLRCESLFI